eukprot:SM000317S12242  [mRNA]  locus=s317:11081:14494:+ [translate_table: standard]
MRPRGAPGSAARIRTRDAAEARPARGSRGATTALLHAASASASGGGPQRAEPLPSVLVAEVGDPSQAGGPAPADSPTSNPWQHLTQAQGALGTPDKWGSVLDGQALPAAPSLLNILATALLSLSGSNLPVTGLSQMAAETSYACLTQHNQLLTLLSRQGSPLAATANNASLPLMHRMLNLLDSSGPMACATNGMSLPLSAASLQGSAHSPDFPALQPRQPGTVSAPADSFCPLAPKTPHSSTCNVPLPSPSTAPGRAASTRPRSKRKAPALTIIPPEKLGTWDGNEALDCVMDAGSRSALVSQRICVGKGGKVTPQLCLSEAADLARRLAKKNPSEINDEELWELYVHGLLASPFRSKDQQRLADAISEAARLAEKKVEDAGKAVVAVAAAAAPIALSSQGLGVTGDHTLPWSRTANTDDSTTEGNADAGDLSLFHDDKVQQLLTFSDIWLASPRNSFRNNLASPSTGPVLHSPRCKDFSELFPAGLVSPGYQPSYTDTCKAADGGCVSPTPEIITRAASAASADASQASGAAGLVQTGSSTRKSAGNSTVASCVTTSQGSLAIGSMSSDKSCLGGLLLQSLLLCNGEIKPSSSTVPRLKHASCTSSEDGGNQSSDADCIESPRKLLCNVLDDAEVATSCSPAERASKVPRTSEAPGQSPLLRSSLDTSNECENEACKSDEAEPRLEYVPSSQQLLFQVEMSSTAGGLVAARSGTPTSPKLVARSRFGTSSPMSMKRPHFRFPTTSTCNTGLKRSASDGAATAGENAKADIRSELSRMQLADPQTGAPRSRRERLTDRYRALQTLLPSKEKTDIATMLQDAADYVNFLQQRVETLSKSSQHPEEAEKQYDLNSRGLCLMSISVVSGV